ncbi:class D beta-lactamase [Ignavibacteria bacterium CHB1]|nr:MAG: class D beta-lactamase [Chlorobiota bacterium]MBV6397703.1 putative beta-lactamase YbxI [Ignavibacteria bacterium]MCC6885483.1 class D beta-lactamase [Ignavibacteriales bacterium]MCE7952835.1 class D beta-lactamase [Chlorobi bacterium CHB7]MDL1886998.1 class D beta-lactamase [Ignavibacteria bacterium CHB1]RIK49596.1 MAG: class D beta-lactamase [Ignavibacteriota bacterium]
MLKYLFIPVTIFSLFLFSCNTESKGHFYETDFSKFFGEFDGAFVLYDYNNKYYIEHNSKKCSTRYSPCSTFKIPNTLIALQLGVIKPDSNFLKWDGTVRSIEAWNSDQTLETAFKNSTVWYYQHLANLIGDENYKHFLFSFDYGNKDISGGIDNFWLYSSLTISPLEQVKFLEKLYTFNLPVDSVYIEKTKELLLQEENEYYRFSGKTGSGSKNGFNDIGWFTGSVELGNNIYIFAILLEGKDASGVKAREISKLILKSMRII